jgi:hypothetical protein
MSFKYRWMKGSREKRRERGKKEAKVERVDREAE